MAWSCSLFYTLVTFSFGKGLPMCAEGVKPIQISPFSSCALVAKQQHFNCDWYKQLGFSGNLARRFKPSFYWCNLFGGCWLCYLLREKERKQNRSVDLLSCPVCRSRTLSGVCFSICFPYREINKLGIKGKSLSPNQCTAPTSPLIPFWRSREGCMWPIGLLGFCAHQEPRLSSKTC